MAKGFLHASGGVSAVKTAECIYIMFSPRQWRCFSQLFLFLLLTQVFSTPVEVFLAKSLKRSRSNCFLHASGGVSFYGYKELNIARFSPRQWRCFQQQKNSLNCVIVFSTPVEVFPFSHKKTKLYDCFLHASGGVSELLV